MSENPELKSALLKKRIAKRNITRLKDKILGGIEDADLAQLELFQSKTKLLSDDVSKTFESILGHCEEAQIDQFIDESQTIQDSLDDLCLLINRQLSKLSVPNTSTRQTEVKAEVSANLKLPKLTLPTFTGQIEEWLTFSDLFTASIHSNASLSAAQKLQYLKSSCKGDALKIIQSIPISDANYSIAWDLLVERFSNTRELINAIIKRLINQPNIPDSAQAILGLVDVVNECQRSLAVLKQNIEGFSEVLVVYMIVEKLDRNTRSWWERSLKKDELGTIEGLTSFLKEHARTLHNAKVPQREQRRSFNPKVATLLSENVNRCPYCKEDHALMKCTQFVKLPASKRMNFVKAKKLCFNCLSQMHQIKTCRSVNKCRICKRSHHSLLHLESNSNSEETNAPDAAINRSRTESSSLSPSAQIFTPKKTREWGQHSKDESLLVAGRTSEDAATYVSSHTHTSISEASRHVLLSTAIIHVKDGEGRFVACRALLDGGSQSNFMTRECADLLKTRREKVNASVCGLNNAAIDIRLSTRATISNKQGDFVATLQFYVIPKITHITPTKYLNIPHLNQFERVNFADPDFYKPGKIDLLLGNEIFLDLLRAERIRVDRLILQETVFGYVAGGSTSESERGINDVYCGFVQNMDDLTNTLKSFWEIEGVEEAGLAVKSQEERECEEHFLRTHCRTEDGRYVVQMPIKSDGLDSLGDSKEKASSRLNELWRRLHRDPALRALYEEFINEYEVLGHMEEVFEDGNRDLCYYLPHHGVYKPEKSTTKLRVVFDASAATTSGVSLNNVLLNGGVVQDDLFSIIARFRTHRYAFTADIEKMYRQILIHPDQRNLQRILWKDSADGPVRLYRLRTVTYGTANAPYLATRVLKQLALDEEQDFPLAASVTRRDFYMDDVLSGSDDLRKAKELQRQLVHLLERGGMHLHKWCASHSEILSDVADRGEYSFCDLDENRTVKTLGLLWKPEGDCFSFRVTMKQPAVYTKRTVLSDIARIFDPLGVIGPVITIAKIFMQKLWLLKTDWNEALPEREAKKWQKFIATLQSINSIQIDRYVLFEHSVEIQIHGFSDASEHAFGAAVYLRCITNSQPSSKLLCSKSRVAPIKSVTIPRLELCAAVLLSQLVRRVVQSLNLEFSGIYLWSDSTVVLAWIRCAPHLLKPFVANRVVKIQELTSGCQWNHVRSEDNPADLISRGMGADKIRNSELWWYGPSFLTEGVDIPCMNSDLTSKQGEEYSREVKKLPKAELTATVTVESSHELTDSILALSNNYVKIVRVLSYIFRFIHNLKHTQEKKTGPLTSEELKTAAQYLLRSVQQKEFESECTLLSRGREISTKSRLRSLNPFLGTDNILRVGGRLHNSNLNYSQKHQSILPAGHRLSKLIMEHYHKKYFHLGPQALLYCVRQEFWPLHGRNLARRVVRECHVCFRNRPVVMEQIMGSLPAERVTPSAPFDHVGVDFCGPFYIKYKGQRKGIFHKVYLAIFVCFATKAVHLELVSDLTSEAFIATLKRFVARRGKCASIFSDNAKTFVGANAELKRLSNLVSRPDQSLADHLSAEGIAWNFIPPRAPNFGGLWEAGVKSVKHHLKRSVGNSKLIFEEFLTVITQIEGILNSRPIMPLSSDANDLEALTPGHFLIGRPMTAIAEPELVDKPENRLSRWQRTTKLVQSIWKRWQRDYLSTLQQRSKWKFQKNDVSIGTLVLIKEDNLPPNKWLLGRITKVFPGADGRVRVVEARTASGVLKRSISKICILPQEENIQY